MKRPTWNYMVDWSAFTVITSLLATGLLLHFRLPSGSGGASVFGMTRHQWGDVHFWIAVALCTIVVIHLLLHLSWIKSLTVGKSKGVRRHIRIWAAIKVACVIMGVVVEFMTWPLHHSQDGQGRRHGAEHVTAPSPS